MLESEPLPEQPISSYEWPVPLVSIDPDVEPLISISFNVFWLPYVLGALTQLLQDTTWKTEDYDELTLVNARAMTLISQFAGGIDSTMPTGTIIAFAGDTEPLGWLLCDGRDVDRLDYAVLFAVIGELYGAGDGTTTFNVPDLRSKFPLGAGDYSLGDQGGETDHFLTTDELPTHTHTVADHSHRYSETFVGFTGPGATNSSPVFSIDVGNNDTGDATLDIQPIGDDQGHNNMPPYIALNYLIKV